MANKVLTQSGNQVQSDLNFVENLAPVYDSTQTYVRGNVVRHEDKLYICVASSTTGSWNNTDWNQIYITYAIYSHLILMKNASNEEYKINVICSRSSPITSFYDLPAQAYLNGDFRINVGFTYLYGRVIYYSPNASGASVAGYVLDDRNNAFTYSSIASQQMTFVSDTVTAI